MPEASSSLTIRHLKAGGIITNYHCTSSCGHCLYNCGPGRDKDVMDEATARAVAGTIRELGCESVHVGGGEPFLDIPALRTVLQVCRQEGLEVEYVETNSSWYRDTQSATETLEDLKAHGLRALLVSMSPFHNEHIPFARVKGVLEACRRTAVGIFPWIGGFYHEINAFNDRRPHALKEYAAVYGKDYVKRIPSRYWIHLGGRALKTFRSVFELHTLPSILSRCPGGCVELLDVSHFHLDLYDNYIPGLCSGLAIRRQDLGSPLSPERYPFLTVLHNSGVRGLHDLATAEHGYKPARSYLSTCDLCTDIRRFLVKERRIDSPELQPVSFYEAM